MSGWDLKAATHALLHRAGVDLVRFPGQRTVLGRRIALLRSYAIDLVLDVGANSGQHARELRSIGYAGRIVSFEPLRDPFRLLQQRAQRDPLWTAVNLALGDIDGSATMHVAGNSVSSSMLEMLPAHSGAAPESRYVADMTVPVRRLDAVAGDYLRPHDRSLLKIDAQGSERKVLDGAAQVMDRLLGLQIELALEPLYLGGTLLLEMISMVEGLGFQLMGIEPGFTDMRTGRLLQADGLFFRVEAPKALVQHRADLASP
jgi:FkbM family methyltransferase